MTVLQAVLGVLVGLAAGILSGLFGVGGGVITQPAVYALLGGTPIQAVATPLPVILPTSVVGAYTYARAGEVSFRAAAWAIPPGIAGAIVGAYLTEFANPHLLLLLTAILMAWTAVRLMRARAPRVPWVRGSTPGWKYGAVGAIAGSVSGLLGVGGGIVIVPALSAVIGMPLKRALGTSLVVIAALVIPGTAVHWALGHVDWSIFAVLTLGVLPGARLGARIALGARERTLRRAVGVFLLSIAAVYGVDQLVALVRGAG